jgi:hypothetical protein
MKKLALLCLFVSASVAAEPFPSQKPVMCDAQETILESLAKNYSEKPVWMGKDLRNDNMYILTANEKESTWTYLETNGKVACVLGAGTKHTPMFGEKI